MDRFGSPVAPRLNGSQGSFGSAANAFGKAFGSAIGAPAAPRLTGSLNSGFSTSWQGGSSEGYQTPTFGGGFKAQLGNYRSPFSSMYPNLSPEYLNDQGKPNYQAGGSPGGGTPGGGGALATYTPGFGQFKPGVEAEINAAAAKFGVPANFLKVILAKESSGNWEANARTKFHRNQPILGYIGVYRDAALSWSDPATWERAQGNRAVQIELLAQVLRGQRDKLQRQYGADKINWLNVASYHYSGKPFGGAAPADSVQHGSADKYMQDVMNWWKMLEPGMNPNGGGSSQIGGGTLPGGGSTAGGGGSIAGGSISTVWGNKGTKNLNYGFGAKNNLGLYAYGRNYGMNGRDHTGIDIPMNIGDPVFTPVSGTVVCACTGSGGGCSAFNDVMGRGCGRVELRLDNGHHVIFGHSSTASVRIGQRVNAGQQIGTAGGMNGGHIHLEWRVPDSSMPSGFRLVDPNQYLNGAPIAGGGVSSPGAGSPAPVPSTPMMSWQRRNF